MAHRLRSELERLDSEQHVLLRQPAGPGVYQAVWGLALRVVVIAELPRTRETLLLRLLGSGRQFSHPGAP